MASRDFAKIVRATNGLQVLFFVEPDGGAYKLHQVVSLQDAQVDFAVGFDSPDEDANERVAFKALAGVGVEHADKVFAHVLDMTGVDVERNGYPIQPAKGKG